MSGSEVERLRRELDKHVELWWTTRDERDDLRRELAAVKVERDMLLTTIRDITGGVAR